MNSNKQQFPVVGWREWMALPALDIDYIKVKVDTGARTSALHAFYVAPFMKNNEQWVRFGIHPIQKNTETVIECEAPVKDQRLVTDSGGHKESRFVIETDLVLGDNVWTAEITLTDRDSMSYRMLLGRTALNGRFLVDPSASYVLGHKPSSKKETRNAAGKHL